MRAECHAGIHFVSLSLVHNRTAETKERFDPGFLIKDRCSTEQIYSPSSDYLWFLDFKSIHQKIKITINTRTTVEVGTAEYLSFRFLN